MILKRAQIPDPGRGMHEYVYGYEESYGLPFWTTNSAVCVVHKKKCGVSKKKLRYSSHIRQRLF